MTSRKIMIEVNSCERDAFSILGKVIYYDKEKLLTISKRYGMT